MGRCCNQSCTTCAKESSTSQVEELIALLGRNSGSSSNPSRHLRLGDLGRTTNTSIQGIELLCRECSQKEILVSELGCSLSSLGLACENPQCMYYDGFGGNMRSSRSVLDSLHNPAGRGHGLGGWGGLNELLSSGRLTDRPRGLLFGFDGYTRSRGSGLGLRDFGAGPRAETFSGYGSSGRLGGRFSSSRPLLR